MKSLIWQETTWGLCNLVVHELENKKKRKILQPTKYYTHTIQIQGRHARFLDRVPRTNGSFISFITTFRNSEIHLRSSGLIYSISRFGYIQRKKRIWRSIKDPGTLSIKCHTKKTETGQSLHRSSYHLQHVLDSFRN